MLVFDNVTYTYPNAGTPAVRDISLAVSAGEIVLCTGPSGCGKSTLIRLANGLCPHFFRGRLQGRTALAGKDTVSLTLQDISRTVGTLFQDPESQFFALTVEDELAFAHEWRGTSPDETLTRVRSSAASFGLDSIMGASVLDLSEGQKQKVALAAIISLDPAVIVLDEPSANLDPEATLALAAELRRLRDAGMAILVVDHRLYWLDGVVDRVVVMNDGRIVAQGDFDLLRDAAFREAWGLRSDRVPDPRTTLTCPANDGDALQAQGLCFAHKDGPELFRDASFSLPAGVTGLLGPNGTGKTTLARLLTGLNQIQAGKLIFRQRQMTPADILRRSSIVLQNTDHQLHMHTVRAELALAAAPYGAESREIVAELLNRFNLSALAQRHPQSLSGGEKQRLVIACGMAKDPEVLILDEPTSGLDGLNMNLVARAIRDAANRGTVVLLISHDLELLTLTCNAALHLPLCGTTDNLESTCSPVS